MIPIPTYHIDGYYIDEEPDSDNDVEFDEDLDGFDEEWEE